MGIHHFWRERPSNNGTGLFILGQHYLFAESSVLGLADKGNQQDPPPISFSFWGKKEFACGSVGFLGNSPKNGEWYPPTGTHTHLCVCVLKLACLLIFQSEKNGESSGINIALSLLPLEGEANWLVTPYMNVDRVFQNDVFYLFWVQ